MRAHPGYLARNLDVANVVGLNAGINNLLSRLKKLKRTPLWLICELHELQERSDRLIPRLIEHRDELPQSMEGA